MYDGDDDLKSKGALSIDILGELEGLFTAWKQHGKLPWNKLVYPAEKLAEGFKITKYLCMQMNTTRGGIFDEKGV